MATYTIILLLLLAAIILPVRLENSSAQDELVDMGVQLDSPSILKILGIVKT